jgi:hypothetical protein
LGNFNADQSCTRACCVLQVIAAGTMAGVLVVHRLLVVPPLHLALLQLLLHAHHPAPPQVLLGVPLPCLLEGTINPAVHQHCQAMQQQQRMTGGSGETMLDAGTRSGGRGVLCVRGGGQERCRCSVRLGCSDDHRL